MGLAASQARFLAITARKADCEFRSMQIAQNKLSVTRELQAATETYQNALNATMLVWDNQEYIDDPQPLSYGILMSPSIYNNYTPYIVTDRANRVIASENIYKAAQKVGIKPEGGTERSEDGFIAFLNALGEYGAISKSTQTNLTNIVGGKYNKNNGYGAEPMSKNELAGLTYSQLAAKMKGQLNDANSTVPSKVEDWINNLAYLFKNGSMAYEVKSDSDKQGDGIRLDEILNNNVVIITTENMGNSNLFGTDGLFQTLVRCIRERGLEITNDDNFKKMCDMAVLMTENQFKNGNITTTTGSAESMNADANKYNSIVESKWNKNTYYAVNISNMLKTFFTYLTIIEDGYKSNYSVDTLSAKSKYVTNDSSYRFQVDADGTETNENIMKLDFYMQLYNNLCINGYKIDERVSKDDEHLEQMLKNGSYFITSLGKDGHFYQSRYNDKEHTCIQVVDDEDAIAVAEAEYNYQKIRLTAKEDRLDLEMKNLDMEISALTTEYDSVKNLIAKSIEKTFKQFEG